MNTVKTGAKYLLILLLVFTGACGRVKSDAKKAAKLTNKSIDKTNQLKLDEAEKLYLKSRDIIDRYESHKKQQKFYNYYQQFRDKDKIKIVDSDNQ